MTGHGRPWKTKIRFPTVVHSPWKSLLRFPHSHSPDEAAGRGKPKPGFPLPAATRFPFTKQNQNKHKERRPGAVTFVPAPGSFFNEKMLGDRPHRPAFTNRAIGPGFDLLINS